MTGHSAWPEEPELAGVHSHWYRVRREMDGLTVVAAIAYPTRGTVKLAVPTRLGERLEPRTALAVSACLSVVVERSFPAADTAGWLWRPMSARAGGRHDHGLAWPAYAVIRPGGGQDGHAGKTPCLERLAGARGACSSCLYSRPAPGWVLAAAPANGCGVPLGPPVPAPSTTRLVRRKGGKAMRLSGMRSHGRWRALRGVREGDRHEAGRRMPDRNWPEATDCAAGGEAMPETPGGVEDRPGLRCVRCGEPIEPWRTGGWVHVGPRGTFWCRDELGMVTTTLAIPAAELRSAAIGSVPSSVVEAMVVGGQGGAG
jgi:hypothetical protein